MNDEAEIDNEDFSFFSGQTPTFRNGPNAAMQSNPHEWQDAILTELASQASNTGEAAAILDCIEELAESLLVPHSNPMSPEELSVLICEILELERRNLQKKVIPANLLSDSLSIVAMQSTRWILRHIMEYYLETLSGLYPDIEFWKGRLRVRKPLRDLLEQGPENWFRPLLGLPYKGRSSLAVLYRHRPDYPRLILRSFRTGIKPLMFSVNISGRIDIQEKVARLYDLKKTLLRKAGLLHHHSFRLGQVPSSDVSQWFEPILDLNRMCCDTEPSNIHSTPDALKALNTILIGLPEMKKRLEQSRNELRRPGHFRRHWLAYTISGIASVYCGRKIYVHRAAIKVLLDRARKVASDFWIEHVSVPLHAIHRRLTRPRLPTLKRTELAEERKTLEIMLREFGMEQLTRNAKLVPPGVSREMFIKQIEKQAALGDMTMVLDSYRNDISKPIYALAAGDLLRCILIQLQKLKVDLEESLFELDEMLEQNEITIELASIVPALLTTLPIVLIMLYQASKLSKADTTSYRAIRRSIHSIHRLLICNYPLDSSKGFETVEDSGKILTHVHRIGKRAIHLRGQKMMSHSAFLLLRKDIKRLISLDFTIEQKRLLIERMYSVHAFLAI